MPSSASSTRTRLWNRWCPCSVVKPIAPSTWRDRSQIRLPLRPAKALAMASRMGGSAGNCSADCWVTAAIAATSTRAEAKRWRTAWKWAIG